MVREETREDRHAIAELWHTVLKRDAEAIVDRLRAQNVDGARGLVAVRTHRGPGADMSDIGAEEVLGHLRLTPAQVVPLSDADSGQERPDGSASVADRVLILAPLAVSGSSRRQGVGTYLVQYALEVVADAGVAAVVTPYDEDFLDRFGFGAAGESDLVGDGGERLRVAHLTPRRVRGTIAVPAALAALI
jgi:predicted N-acetyltransferase YhbS